MLSIGLLAACETGGQPSQFDGVSVYCFDDNENNQIVVHNGTQFEAVPPQYAPFTTLDGLQVCIRPPDDPAPFDYVNDWVGGGGGGDTGGTGGGSANISYPIIEAALRQRCSERCVARHDKQSGGVEYLPDGSGPYPVCEDSNWTQIITQAWHPSYGLNCIVGKSGWLVGDGSEVDWDLAPWPGPQSLPVDCDLNGDCTDYFWASLADFIMPLSGIGPIAPETRRADYLASDVGSMDLAIVIDPQQSPTAGPNDMQPVHGIAEYSAADCGQAACPLYLGNLFGTGPNAWEVDLAFDDGNGGTVVLPKSLRDVQLDLMQSVMGVRRMSDGVVAFGEGTVHMQLSFTVESCPTCDPTGDGPYTIMVENKEVLFGFFNPIPTLAGHASPAFEINLSFPFQSGFIAVNVYVEPDEHPPEAGHTLPASRRCNDPDGYLLPPSALASVDPDLDLAFQYWVVDGLFHDPSEPIPVGQHTIAVEAWDSRGAVHRSETTNFTVSQSTICM